MKPLAVIGCSLTEDGLAAQAARVRALRPTVAAVERAPGLARVVFARDVDHSVLCRFVETEQGCCSFLELRYDDHDRVLSITSKDPARERAVAVLAEGFRPASDGVPR